MAITTIPGGGFYLPQPYAGSLAPATTVKVSFSAANARASLVFHVARSGNIDRLVWRTSAVTTGATIDVRLETVDATTGDPTGTLVGTNTNASVVVGSGDDNVVFETTLTAAATVSAGDVIAAVFVNPGASFGNMQIAGMNFSANGASMPYGGSYAGSWTKQIATILTLALRYDDATYEVPGGGYVPPVAITTTTYSTSSTPDVLGLRFQVPVGVRVRGAWLAIDLDGDALVAVVSTAYNSGAGTGILASVTLDTNQRGTTGGSLHFLTFDAPVDLTAATNYRLIVEPTTTTNLTVYDASVGSLGLLNCFPGGSNFHLTTAKNPTGDGDWTNYNSGTFRNPYMGLLIDGIDAGSAAVASSYPFLG